MARGEAQEERRTGGIHQGAPEKISIDERENINLNTRFRKEKISIDERENVNLSTQFKEREDINTYTQNSI